MNQRRFVLIVIIFLIMAGLLAFGFYAGKQSATPREQFLENDTESTEQFKEQDEGVTPVQPDVNTQEFKLSGSNVSCTSSTVNGVTTSSCSGSIRVVPRAQADMDPGLYKINEQTKLYNSAGAAQDLNSLQQLAQAQTIVRLKLVEGSNDTLAEIRY